MAYIGNDLKVAYPSYLNIDDISGSFNGSTTSFALLVGGVAPSPLPLNSQQCLISVGGVIQRPDDTGTEGFRLSGGNIVFSSAPGTGEDFFGVILAGADYVNAGANFPSGSAGVPSITFDSDLDTGIYNSAANQVGVTCAGSSVSVFSSAGQSFLAGSAGAPSLYPTGDTNTGFWSPAADTIAISTGGSERTRVDSSGRLLVGTSSARATNVAAASNIGAMFERGGGYNAVAVVGNANTPDGAYIALVKSRGTTTGATTVVANDDYLGALSFEGTDGTNPIPAAQIVCRVDGTPGANDMPGRLVFSTTLDGASSPTERMRISNTGATTITCSQTDAYGLNIITDTGNQYNLNLSKSVDQNTVNEYYINAIGGSTLRFRVVGNGGIYNYSANNSNLSDINTKKDISLAADTWDCVKQWEIVNYRYKNQPDDADLNLGVIAQQVAESCPEVITVFEQATEDQPEKLGIKEQQMYWMAIKALQEAQVRIEALEAEVAALKAA